MSRQSDRMKALWADPEWRARQCDRISDGQTARWRPHHLPTGFSVSVGNGAVAIAKLAGGAVLVQPMRFIPHTGFASALNLPHQIGSKGSDVDSLKGSVEGVGFHTASDMQGGPVNHDGR